MYTFIFGLLLILTSCATSKEDRMKAWESWNGLNVSEIEKHPYFKNLKAKKLKHEKGPETWIYKDQTPFQTSAYCQSLGSCQGMQIYNCESAFSIENDVILGFEQTGTCPNVKITEAKKK